LEGVKKEKQKGSRVVIFLKRILPEKCLAVQFKFAVLDMFKIFPTLLGKKN
jgi:hypothetical protein